MNDRPALLIVEDELALLSVLTEALSDAGYVVHQAANALGAFEMLHAFPEIGLLVTDIGLPGTGDGRSLAEFVRNTRPGIKIVFVTGSDVASSDPGVAGSTVLNKPFSLDDLVAAVRTSLSEQPSEAERA
jgi:DNA-binding response OmpR family regulator